MFCLYLVSTLQTKRNVEPHRLYWLNSTIPTSDNSVYTNTLNLFYICQEDLKKCKKMFWVYPLNPKAKLNGERRCRVVELFFPLTAVLVFLFHSRGVLRNQVIRASNCYNRNVQLFPPECSMDILL